MRPQVKDEFDRAVLAAFLRPRVREVVGDGSYREAAAQIGVSKGAIENFLKGSVPQRDVLRRIREWAAERGWEYSEAPLGADHGVDAIATRPDGSTLLIQAKGNSRPPRANERSGESIRAIRIRAGQSVEEFAAGLGVEPRTVRLWETGEVLPDEVALERIAERTGTLVLFVRYDWPPREESAEDAVYRDEEVRVGVDVADSVFRDLADVARTLRQIGPPGMDYKDKRGALDAIADYYAHVGKRRPQEWWDLHEALEAGKI